MPSIEWRYFTGNNVLDKLLIGAQGPILVYGEAGVGKTNLALHISRIASLSGKRVLYVNTEGWAYKGRISILDGLDNVVFVDINDFWLQTLFILSIIPLIVEDYDLIVIDTINNLFRCQEDIEAATRSLSAQMGILYWVSVFKKRKVLVLGQVKAGEEGEEISGATYIKFWASVIVRLERKGSTRILIIEKPENTGLELEFEITNKGIKWLGP